MTVVGPTENAVPLATLEDVDTTPEWSNATGSAHHTMAVGELASVLVVMFAEQLTKLGFSASE